MSQTDKKIAQLIDSISHKRGDAISFTIMSGTVVAGSVDTEEVTCTVLLSSDDADTPTEGVLLNAVTLDANGLILYPADGSNVWVAEIDGPGKWGIIKCSDLVKAVVTCGSAKLTITDGLIQLNDGSLGGLVEVAALVGKLNTLENDLNMIKTIFKATWVPVPNDGGAALKTAAAGWAGSSLTDTVRGDIEDTKVKH